MLNYSFLLTAAFFVIFIGLALGKEVPAGLRPAKAVDDPEKPIVPKLEEEGEDEEDEVPKAEEEEHGRGRGRGEQKQEENKLANVIASSSPPTATGERPLIFQKNGKGKRRLNPTAVLPGSGTQVVQQVIKPPEPSEGGEGTSTKAAIRTIPPPAGKDYGVNTLLQTNLVDSKGRVLKGINSVPIPVPDIRNAKASRASASRVETEAEKAVQINFSG